MTTPRREGMSAEERYNFAVNTFDATGGHYSMKELMVAQIEQAMESAREEERFLCADYVRHVHGENTLADELEKRSKMESIIRSQK